jgi:hypothetical protein
MKSFNDYLKEAKKLSPKQKKIAAIAGDKDKIDADDLVALRAGKKPVEEADELAKEEVQVDESKGLPHALVQTGKEKWHIYDTKTQKLHSTYNNKNVAMKKYAELNDKHTGYDSPGGLVKSKYGVRKEEVEQIDEVTDNTNMMARSMHHNVRKEAEKALKHAIKYHTDQRDHGGFEVKGADSLKKHQAHHQAEIDKAQHHLKVSDEYRKKEKAEREAPSAAVTAGTRHTIVVGGKESHDKLLAHVKAHNANIPRGQKENRMKATSYPRAGGKTKVYVDGKKEHVDKVKKMFESVEINEIGDTDRGQKALVNYLKAAPKSSRIHGMISKDYANAAERKRNPGLKSALDNLSKKYKSKAWKREDGINRAVDRLAKEEAEELAERDEGKPGKMFAKIADKAAKKYGSKEIGNKVAGAIRQKVLAKEEAEELDEGKMKDIYTDMMHHADKKGYSSHKEFTPADYDTVGKQHGISGKELAVIAGHKTAQQADTHFKKPVEPGKGMDRAKALAQRGMQSLSKEEVEQIDELKASTLTSYVKKAGASLDKSHNAANKAYKKYDDTDDDKDIAAGDKANATYNKRHTGISTALNKLTKKANDSALGEEVSAEMSPYLKATLAVMDEGKIDNLRDAQKLRQDTQSAYDKNYKPDESHPHIQVVKGRAYGAGEEDNEGDENKPDNETKEKRGRGRPHGSKSGARQKGNGHEDGGIPVHNLHLPNRNK